MSYIYQHTQDRMNGLATFNLEDLKFKISTQLIGDLIEKELNDKVAIIRLAEGREVYDRIIEKESK